MSDPRLTPSNRRVAHVSLEGRAEAEAFVAGESRRVAVPVVDLCRSPGGARDKQMLAGWGFTVLERSGGWAFGFDTADGYVGYLPEPALGPDVAPTHRVTARASHVYGAPDIKARETAALSFFSQVAVTGSDGRFCALAGGGFVPAPHLAPLSWLAGDAVTVAEMFLGTPYLWGGNSAAGIDCSGLVQLALWAAGHDCPRDSDMQMALGVPVEGGIRRGDLLFWAGHVALVVDDARLIHANAHHMAVACEGIEAATARIAAQGDGPVIARRRIA